MSGKTMLALSRKWAPYLVAQPETGMGYQIVTLVLRDGRRFEQVIVQGGFITQIRGLQSLPFAESDISEIIVTHDKWEFGWA